MAITSTDRGAGSNGAAGTTINAATALTGTMSAGNTGVLVISMDNANGAIGANTTQLSSTGGSYTDSKGNVWYMRTNGFGGTANTNAEGAILSSLLTSSLASSDTLTITFAVSTTAKAWTFTELSTNVTGASVVYAASAIASNTAATTAPTITSGTIDKNDVIVGAGFAENDDIWTADSDTSNGSWSTAQHSAGGGGTTSSVTVITQTKVATAYATQIYNPTLSSSSDARCGWAKFAEADSRARALASNSTGEGTTTVTVSQPVAANSIGVLCFSVDNTGTSGTTTNLPTSINDSKSNTWSLQQTRIYAPISSINTGAELGIWTSVLSTPLVVSDTIGITYLIANATQKAWCLFEIAPTGAGSMTYVTGGTQAGSNTASPSMTTGSSVTSGDYIVAALAAEAIDNMTGDSDTTNGTWGPMCTKSAGTAVATGQTLVAQIKKVTATATQTYDVTSGDGACDCTMGWVQIHDSSPTGGLTASQKAAFFQMF